MKNSIIQEYSEKEKHLESVYSEGMLTADELRDRRVSLYCELRDALSQEEGGVDGFSEEDLLKTCGLKREDLESDIPQPELGFDPLKDGGVYIFKGLKDVEALWRETEPEGKCFTFQIPFAAGVETVWEAFQFEIQYAKPGTDNWKGWNVYTGQGQFSVYAGEGSLMLRERGDGVESVLYQKCYRKVRTKR